MRNCKYWDFIEDYQMKLNLIRKCFFLGTLRVLYHFRNISHTVRAGGVFKYLLSETGLPYWWILRSDTSVEAPSPSRLVRGIKVKISSFFPAVSYFLVECTKEKKLHSERGIARSEGFCNCF